ncbi:MGMT family protein [Maridesulfovibrio sp.]|uniref:MGMT family protein n=1 Tax=Maridesulfovibrio sp. TaxID=2795000 RepID=UPI002A18E1DA|nr:MGMT family protein [Maridesulfovibrio sp.]
MSANVFTARAIEVIRLIPRGRVATYGGVAALAGNGRAARQVVRVLHTYSRNEGLPWHRVVNREGCISLARGNGYEEQMELLMREGVEFGPGGRIDLDVFLWKPANKRQIDFDETCF